MQRTLVGSIDECCHVVLLGDARRHDPGREEGERELCGRGRVAAEMEEPWNR